MSHKISIKGRTVASSSLSVCCFLGVSLSEDESYGSENGQRDRATAAAVGSELEADRVSGVIEKGRGCCHSGGIGGELIWKQ
jgi:hypothetical protein